LADDWYPWGTGLGEEELASALAAVSIAPKAATEEAAAATIHEQLRSGLPLLLSALPAPHEEWNRALSAASFITAWEAAWNEPREENRRSWHAVRTAAVPAEALQVAGTDQEWFSYLRRCLLSVQFNSVVVHSAWNRPARWAWPVRIGVLSEDGTLGPFARFRRHPWSGKLFQLLRARGSRQHFDALLVNGSDRLTTEADCTSTAVVLFGEPPAALSKELQSLQAARKAVAAPIAILQPPPEKPDRWLYHLVEELAHGHPLHAVVSAIWDPATPWQPLVLGDRQALAQVDLEQGTSHILKEAHCLVDRGVGDQEVVLSPRLQADLDLASAASLDEIVGKMEESLEQLVYERESEGATTLGELAAAVTRADRAADRTRAGCDLTAWTDSTYEMAGGSPGSRGTPRATPTAEALRILRARLLSDGETLQKRGPLRPDTAYSIEASVGPPANDWLGLPTPFVTPDAPPDDPERGWLLRVVAWEPTWMPQPVEEQLWLPQKGPSETISFGFRTGAEPGTLGARITVLHENRILQTGLLVSHEDNAELSWTLDAAPEPQLGTLDPDRWFAASFIVNDDATGNPRLTCISDHELGLLDLAAVDLEKFTDTISGSLRDIAMSPNLYEALDSDDTVDLLRSIAQHGWNLYETLIFDTGLDEARMRKAERIQIVSATPTSYFPAEFLYSFEAPDPDAKLCPGAAAALVSEDGKCQEAHSRTHVCPTGFWSLSKVVERHAFVKEDLDLDASFALYDATDFHESPTVDPLRHLVFAASQKVDGFDSTATNELQQRATAVSAGCTPIDSLDTWRTAVEDERPSLFVFLPHHFRSGTHEMFEMGPTLEIQPSEVRKDLVRRDDAPQPLVLLVGCETVDTRIAFDSFVQKFRRYGASVVISTFATILGRHAAPATSEFLEELDRRLASGPVRLGDVLFDIRRKLLADGKPMVLGLTSYGDADVLLSRS